MHKAGDVQTICLVTKMPQNYTGLKKLWKQDLFTETFPQLSSLGIKKIDTNKDGMISPNEFDESL